MILSAHCQPDKPENPSRIASYFRLQEAKQKAETLASFFRSLRMTNVRMYARSKFFCVRQFLILILSTHLCQHKLSFFDLAFDISVVFNNLKGIFLCIKHGKILRFLELSSKKEKNPTPSKKIFTFSVTHDRILSTCPGT
jgi:hypothetical protein